MPDVGSEDDRARILSVVPNDRTEASGHKLKYKAFHINAIPSLFTATVVKWFNELPRETMEPPAIEILSGASPE